MDLFQIFGTLAIKGMDAFSSDIASATSQAEESSVAIDSAFGRMATGIGSAISKAGEHITNLGTKLAPVSALAGTVIATAVKSASDYEDSLAKVSTLVDTSIHPISELSDTFLNLSNETGKSASELAEAGYQALSASVEYDNLGSFVQTATNLAKVGFTDSSTAVDVLTTAMNAFGDEAGTADQIAQKLVRTQNLGKTTVNELASSMGKVIPTASGMNVSIDNLTAGYVSLTKQGIATAEATTYMNSMMNELGDSGTDVGGILKEKTGKSFQDLMADGYSLADVLQITKDYATENGIAYNELWGSAEAGKASLALLNGGVEEFNATVETMQSDVDDVSIALDKLDTPSAKVNKSINRLKNTSTELGQTFLTALQPTIDAVSGAVETATNWFSNLDDGTKNMIATVITGIAVISPILVIGGKIISGLGNIITKIPMLISTLSSLWSTLLANPIALVIAVVVALVAGFLYLWNTSEDFRNFWINLWNNIKETVTNIVNAVSAFLTKAWTDINTSFTNAWNAISTFFKNIWNGIQTTVKTIVGAIGTFLTKAWNDMKTSATNVWNAVKTSITNILNGIKTTFSNVWNGIKTTVSNIINGIKTIISNGINGAKTTVTNVLNAIKTQFSNILNGAYSIVSGAIEKIKGAFNFSWSLPKLKMPHVTISGSFSLMPPSVPKFGISWYKKAMDNPYLFTSPTMFSYDPTSNVGKVAGESGDEMMYGRSNLMADIGSVVADQNISVSEKLDTIIKLLSEYLPELLENAVKQIVLDSDVLVGELAPAMNSELGNISRRAGR